MNINDLPHELLEEIFSYFIRRYNNSEPIELPKLSTVCKNFNDVIQNSARLMKGLTIVWKEEGRDAKALLASKRQYRNILFLKTTKTSPCLAKFLELQPSITKLKFYACTVSTFTFWMIVNLVRDSLEQLNIADIKFTDDGDFIPICLPNLSKLDLSYNVPKERILNLFELPLSLNEFVYFNSSKRDTTLSDEGFAAYRDILINSKHLHNLEINGVDLLSQLFSDSVFAEQAKFKLEVLNMKFTTPSIDQLPNFFIFLSRQTCLKIMELWNFLVTHESLKSILSMRTLKKLTFETPIFQISRKVHLKSTSIEKLYICNDIIDKPTKEPPIDTMEYEIGICEIIKACPSVEILHLTSYHVTKTISKAIVKHLKKLGTLDVFLHWKMSPTNFPTVSDLTVIENFYDESVVANAFLQRVQRLLDFVRLNPQLKTFRVDDYVLQETNFRELVKGLNLVDLKIEEW